jgi:hypothetical protein
VFPKPSLADRPIPAFPVFHERGRHIRHIGGQHQIEQLRYFKEEITHAGILEARVLTWVRISTKVLVCSEKRNLQDNGK